MASTVLLLFFTLAMAALWHSYRASEREAARVVAGPAQRSALRLRELLIHGEISPEDYDRLLSLIS